MTTLGSKLNPKALTAAKLIAKRFNAAVTFSTDGKGDVVLRVRPFKGAAPWGSTTMPPPPPKFMGFNLQIVRDRQENS